MDSFDDLAAGWPAEVASYYRDLAARRQWHASVTEAVARHVEYLRHLSLTGGPRSYWRGTFAEEGSEWFYETVIDADGTNTAIRQVVIQADGRVGRYSWERMEDEDGGLAEVALDESLDWLEAIAEADFILAWRGSRQGGP